MYTFKSIEDMQKRVEAEGLMDQITDFLMFIAPKENVKRKTGFSKCADISLQGCSWKVVVIAELTSAEDVVFIARRPMLFTRELELTLDDLYEDIAHMDIPGNPESLEGSESITLFMMGFRTAQERALREVEKLSELKE